MINKYYTPLLQLYGGNSANVIAPRGVMAHSDAIVKNVINMNRNSVKI